MREEFIAASPFRQTVPFERRLPVNAYAPFAILLQTSLSQTKMMATIQTNLVFALLEIRHDFCLRSVSDPNIVEANFHAFSEFSKVSPLDSIVRFEKYLP
jgi:hypothetical protein